MTKIISVQCIHCSEILILDPSRERLTKLKWLKHDEPHLETEFLKLVIKTKELRKKCFWNNDPAPLKHCVLAVLARSETSFTSVSLLLKKNGTSAQWQPETFDFQLNCLFYISHHQPNPASSSHSFRIDDYFCGQLQVKVIHENI